MQRLFVVAVAALLVAAHGAQGLYFHIKESETKCFIEEVADDTLVSGKYRTQLRNPDGSFRETSPGVGIHVQVKDPSGDLIMSKDYEAAGRFTFNSHEPGEHVICINTNSTRWFGGNVLRVHLDLKIGEGANDYALIAKKEQLSSVETRLYQLLSQVKQINNEQAYQRTREATFREISESTNQRVLFWSIAQAIVLVLTGYWQLNHLRNFFTAKKLV